MPRPWRAADVPAEIRDRRERYGRGPDGEADRRGLAHVVARHSRVGETHGERQRRDQDGGEYTCILTTKWPAESD
jgi:hypothetical protein